MRIHWTNIIAFISVLLALILIAKWWKTMDATVSSIRGIGPVYATDDKIFGLIAFGLIVVLLVAILRLLTRNGR